jgi:hypothetical protein
MRILVAMLLVLAPLSAQRQPPKNLKVLTPEELSSGVMAKYVQALGVQQSGGCNFCHAQDKASDEKPQKLTARMMIQMVKDVNTKIAGAAGGAAKEYVTCYTCHRGKTEPDTAPAPAQ